jgi:excisionase family DNA binding protein
MEILTVSQASKYCKVSSKTIINWIDAGYIKAYKTVGGHRRIKKEDLDHFLKEKGMPLPEEAKLEERKKILVVDDDKIIVETIVQALEEDEYGYEMISASDGFEAGIQVSHFKPDIMVDWVARDLAGAFRATHPPDDIAALKRCKPGKCDVKIGTKGLDAAAESAWGAPREIGEASRPCGTGRAPPAARPAPGTSCPGGCLNN